MSSWKRAGCQTESKALEKSIVERFVREFNYDYLNVSQGKYFGHQKNAREQNIFFFFNAKRVFDTSVSIDCCK